MNNVYILINNNETSGFAGPFNNNIFPSMICDALLGVPLHIENVLDKNVEIYEQFYEFGDDENGGRWWTFSDLTIIECDEFELSNSTPFDWAFQFDEHDHEWVYTDEPKLIKPTKK